ncbi:amidohydrolase family protein [Dyella sp.]|uniref:amidohydrolase family protein n=1 Tax=Dyella sp. TaxID=1869338 RepID=UPI002D78D04D|nr:amidohydrolase family protein [Dyella sp.]HET7332678.1 amidohydrolase family protein [Dyella sp.]
MKMVGIEEHVLPGEIRQAWTTLPGADDGTLMLNAPAIAERLADLGEKRLALMDETGIDMQVLLLTTPGLNNLGEHGVDLARRVNDRLAEVVQRHPSRFRALASLPFASADAAARELSRAVTELGALGAILYGRVGNKHLDDEMFEATFACAAELNVPLLTSTDSTDGGTPALLRGLFADY